MYSKRVNTIGESQTAKIASIAIRMKRDNIDIVDFTVGEPDFPTPQNIKKAAIDAINNDLTRYTLIPGIRDLRLAIQKKLKSDNNLAYDLDSIIVTSGAKQAIFNTLMAIVDKDDEVIIPAPYWVSYPEMVSIAEGKPIILPTLEEHGFKLTPQQLEQHITDKTKAIIICNPSNPTGTVYSESELASLAKILENHDVFIISDEIYEKLIYDNLDYVSLASISSTLKKKTVVINGLSKAYAMTGWRLGYAAADKDLIKKMATLQSHSTTNATTISQYAGIEALEGSQEEIKKMHQEFEQRRDFVYKRLQGIDGITCVKPQGAFYAFPNISKYLHKKYNGTQVQNSSDLAVYLLNEAKVVLIPGSAFGADDHIRISYATSMERLSEGMNRIESALRI
jgi:aspartate/methionine/tyrosine aminotransferase